MALKKTSITDLPKIATDKDNFGIEPFEKGLIRFINRTSTPITIALQGEWGSGKTSLMNSLKMKLSEGKDSKFHSIWLNTWEYSLMKETQNILMDIITDLIKEISKIAKVDETKTKKMLNTLWSGIKDTTKVVAKNALDNTIAGAGSIVDSFSSDSGKSSLGAVRKELEEVIEVCIKKDNKEGFIFFIDDLDRIDPPIAVQLLELLKNIFTLKNSVFVLAIDYDVVIKGLKPKFGELTSSNEREFRSFFDKIIQVPFAMPVSNYQINDFIKESLITTEYLKEEYYKKDDLIALFSEIAHLSVGTNPRALKRLMNSLSLISCINQEKDGENELNEKELVINFALVSIQIAYPPIYRILTRFPGFDKWDESIALQLDLKEMDEQTREQLSRNEAFDEEWEQVLYRYCQNDFYLKKKTLNISLLLNLIKKFITDEGEVVENMIKSIISLSSVTSVDGEKEPEIVQYHKGHFLKTLRRKLIESLRQKMPDKSDEIGPQGKRVQSNAIIKFNKNDWGVWMNLFSYPNKDGVVLVISSARWIGKAVSSFKDDWNRTGVDSKIHQLLEEFINFIKPFKHINTLNIDEFYKRIKKQNQHHVLYLEGFMALPKPEDYYESEIIDEISNFMKGFYDFIIKFNEVGEEHHRIFEELN